MYRESKLSKKVRLSLCKGRIYATHTTQLSKALLHRDSDINLKSAFAKGMFLLEQELFKHFPENIFADFDMLLAHITTKAKQTHAPSKYFLNNFAFSPKLLFVESFVLSYLVLLSWFLFFTTKINDEFILFFILVVFNLIFLALSLTITYVGITLKRYSLVNLGLFASILFIFTKYFDLFMGMIDTGLFFAITGLLLLLGGVSFERIRRRLLDRFDLNEG